MIYRCFACNFEAVELFYGKEKAFETLMSCSNRQKEIFLERHNLDELEKMLKKAFHEVKIYQHEIILKLHNEKTVILRLSPDVIETNQITQNPLFDFLKRYKRNWCCLDDSSQVHWFCSCNFEDNCVK